MKKKLELGSQIDINASFDGGADDTSVTYSVPTDQQDVISVTSAGVVEALAVGTATVEIKDTSGNLLRAVVFQVLSAADFAMQDDLDTGVAAFTAEFAAVVPAPPPSLAKISPAMNRTFVNPLYNGFGGWILATNYVHFAAGHGPLNSTSSGTGYNALTGVAEAGRYDYLYDGLANTFWYDLANRAAVGYYGPTATVIKEVRLKSTDQNLTSRPTQVILYGSNQDPTSLAEPGSPAFGYGVTTGWAQIGTASVPVWGNVVSEDRTVDFSANTTAYKHYKLEFTCGNETYFALAGLELWGF